MEKKETLRLRITPEMKQALEAVSSLSSVPVSEIVRNTLESAIWNTNEMYNKTFAKDLDLKEYKEELEIIRTYAENWDKKILIPIRADMFQNKQGGKDAD